MGGVFRTDREEMFFPHIIQDEAKHFKQGRVGHCLWFCPISKE